MDLETLKAFEGKVAEAVPGFQVGYKDKSPFQKLLGFLIHPFNPDFMTSYTTTLYPKVFFPTQEFYETKNKSFTILSHEFVHLFDTKKHPFWMKLSYLMPQALGVLPLLAFCALAWPHAWILGLLVLGYLLGCVASRVSLAMFWCVMIGSIIATGVFAVLFTGWLSAIFFAGLALFAPWPSPWRTKWELRGYTMNLVTMQWMHGAVPEILKQSVLRQFTTPKYYFMSWSEDAIYRQLTSIVNRSEEIQREYPYSVVYDFLSSRNLLKK